MKKPKLRLLSYALSAIMLLAGYTAALSHIDVPLKDAMGNPVSGNTPYSPRQTCATASCHDYGSGTMTVSKVQGYLNSSGKMEFQNYNVTAFSHGVSAGKHSSQGRGEELTAAQRSIWGAPGFISSPGMWGRY